MIKRFLRWLILVTLRGLVLVSIRDTELFDTYQIRREIGRLKMFVEDHHKLKIERKKKKKLTYKPFKNLRKIKKG